MCLERGEGDVSARGSTSIREKSMAGPEAQYYDPISFMGRWMRNHFGQADEGLEFRPVELYQRQR